MQNFFRTSYIYYRFLHVIMQSELDPTAYTNRQIFKLRLYIFQSLVDAWKSSFSRNFYYRRGVEREEGVGDPTPRTILSARLIFFFFEKLKKRNY